MKNESKQWFQYAEENYCVAELCLQGGLFNACVQNVQQPVEKALKAFGLTVGLPLKKTHSIRELVADLRCVDVTVEISEDDIDLLDSVYLPSKYPLSSVLPDFTPDHGLAQHCVQIAGCIMGGSKK